MYAYITYAEYRPEKVANPARGQLNRENENISLSPFTPKNLVVRPSRPASASSLSKGLNLILTHGIRHASCDGVHLFIPSTVIGSVPSFIRSSDCVPMTLTAESPPAQGQQSSKAVAVAGAAFSGTSP